MDPNQFLSTENQPGGINNTFSVSHVQMPIGVGMSYPSQLVYKKGVAPDLGWSVEDTHEQQDMQNGARLLNKSGTGWDDRLQYSRGAGRQRRLHTNIDFQAIPMLDHLSGMISVPRPPHKIGIGAAGIRFAEKQDISGARNEGFLPTSLSQYLRASQPVPVPESEVIDSRKYIERDQVTVKRDQWWYPNV